MKLSLSAASLALAIGALVGCSNTPQSPDVAGNIRKSIDQAGIKNVSVAQDRTRGVVTLTGHVLDTNDKARADQIARSQAQGQVVANESQSPRRGTKALRAMSIKNWIQRSAQISMPRCCSTAGIKPFAIPRRTA